MRGYWRLLASVLLALALLASRGHASTHAHLHDAFFHGACANPAHGPVPPGEDGDCDECCEVSEILLFGDLLPPQNASSISPFVFWRVLRPGRPPAGIVSSEIALQANRARAPPSA